MLKLFPAHADLSVSFVNCNNSITSPLIVSVIVSKVYMRNCQIKVSQMREREREGKIKTLAPKQKFKQITF